MGLWALLTLALCLQPVAPPAHAEELLVMPFSCEIRGGRPRLTPGPERGYRILGGREQRTFNACSRANPGMCRRWTVYRFELDCDGEPVAWMEVVAAASEASRRARLVDGRLELRMPPRWSLPQDDPCAYEPGSDPFGDRARQRRCAERLERAPPAVVELPRGFAPMLGIDAIFVRTAPHVGKAPPFDPPPEEEVAAGAEQAQPIPRAEPPPSKPAGEATAKRTPPPAAAPPPPAPPPKSIQEANAKTPPPASPPPAKETVTPPKEVAAPASPPPSGTPPPKSQPQPETRPAAKVAAAPPAPERKTVPQPPPPATGTAAKEEQASGPSLFTVRDLRTPTVGFLVAFMGLTLGLLIAFAAARRRERLQHASARRPRARGTPRLGFDDGDAAPESAGSPLEKVPGAAAADAALAALGERMPQTRKEAFDLIAAGLGRRADAAALKKVVDALRRAWYPDWAKDDADRRVRELRSKQINAAWDLLQPERADV
jgi:hypothetical protein